MIGYSGTSLQKKLGIRAPMRVLVIGAPVEYAGWLGELPPGVDLISTAEPLLQAVHLFAVRRDFLVDQLITLREQLQPTGFVWVSWPKKASKIPTEVDEDVIRAVALPMGFVDIKVCAVSEIWSGLKLVIRLSLRTR